MDKEGWCRPKVWRQYIFGDQCWISCLPQQRWQFKREKAGEVTIFSEKRHIWLRVTAEDFEQQWKEV